MGASIAATEHGSITILEMQRPKANAFDITMLEELQRHFTALSDEWDPRTLVLTGTGAIFSAGVDLFEVVQGGASYVDRFFPLLVETFTRLFTLPIPVIAAINGHAIAGGCVLAAACDYRIMATGTSTIGVPELRVQVPFPTIAVEILRFASASAHFQELVYLGRTYTVKEAHQRGLIDEIAEPDMLLQRAQDVSRRLHAIPPETFRLTKAQVRGATRERIDRLAPTQDAIALELWRAPRTHQAIERYLKDRFGRDSAS